MPFSVATNQLRKLWLVSGPKPSLGEYVVRQVAWLVHLCAHTQHTHTHAHRHTHTHTHLCTSNTQHTCTCQHTKDTDVPNEYTLCRAMVTCTWGDKGAAASDSTGKVSLGRRISTMYVTPICWSPGVVLSCRSPTQGGGHTWGRGYLQRRHDPRANGGVLHRGVSEICV